MQIGKAVQDGGCDLFFVEGGVVKEVPFFIKLLAMISSDDDNGIFAVFCFFNGREQGLYLGVDEEQRVLVAVKKRDGGAFRKEGFDVVDG